MTLNEAVKQLESLDDDAFLCVRRPWGASADCVVTAPDERLRVPATIRDQGFVYFLDVHVAREVLEVFGDKPPSLDEKVRLLIDYAENDAYPEWVYER